MRPKPVPMIPTPRGSLCPCAIDRLLFFHLYQSLSAESLSTGSGWGTLDSELSDSRLKLRGYFAPSARNLLTSFSTTVPVKKPGFIPVHSVVGLVNTKSRKSLSSESRVPHPDPVL